MKSEDLMRLTERYCVVYQTLRQPPQMSISRSASPAVPAQ